MAGQLIVVETVRDEEAGVWYVESTVPGLNAEDETLAGLIEKLPPIVRDLVEEGALDG